MNYCTQIKSLQSAMLRTIIVGMCLYFVSCKNEVDSPQPSVAAKAISLPAPLGWATQNGGTTGGAGGSSVVVSTPTQLTTALAKSGKYIIYVQGTLTGYVMYNVTSDKTIYGLPGATIQGYLNLKRISNVILRNLTVRGEKCTSYDNCKNGNDAVHIESAHNIWLDHVDVADGQDGNCDVTHASDFVTISWCKFHYTYAKVHAFSNLIGNVDNNSEDIGKLNVTFHHNWWADNVLERQPRIRYGKIHVANNLYTSTVASYDVGPGISSSVLVEGNIMKSSSTTPIETSFNGNTNYSAVLGRNNVGPSGANLSLGGTVFKPPYALNIDATSNLEATVRQNAGATLPDPR